jgi:hypothetical protein
MFFPRAAKQQNSAKFGTFGTRLTLFCTDLASFGTWRVVSAPPVFRGETACLARFGSFWHGFRKFGPTAMCKLKQASRKGAKLAKELMIRV